VAISDEEQNGCRYNYRPPMGFCQCLLRGLEKVRSGWDLVCLAYNMKRLYNLQAAKS